MSDGAAPAAGSTQATDAEDTVGARYSSARTRVTELLDGIGTEAWERPVGACPGWRVRDVLAHLVGIIEDAVAGRLSGPPPPELTAAEVDRHRGDDPAELLATWTAMAPIFEDALTERGLWPAFLDVLSHEHDLRTALGTPGQRDHPDVQLAADLLTQSFSAPVPIEIDLGDRIRRPAGGSGTPLVLRTDAFEILRLRLGRRSRAQVAGLDWSSDPEPVLDHLFVFGPRPDPLVE